MAHPPLIRSRAPGWGMVKVVTTKQNFDDLLIKRGHASRRPSDTYYVDQDRVLRTHTSAHQVPPVPPCPAYAADLVGGWG